MKPKKPFKISGIEAFYVSVILFIAVMLYLSTQCPYNKPVSFIEEYMKSHEITLDAKPWESQHATQGVSNSSILAIFDTNTTLAQNDIFRVIQTGSGEIALLDKKSKKVVKKFPPSKDPILAAAFYKNYLFLYSDRIDGINLESMQMDENISHIGLSAESAKIFPIKKGVIVYLVRNNRPYLLYYHYMNAHKKTQACNNLYPLKAFPTDFKADDEALLVKIDGSLFKFSPRDDCLAWEKE
ncbi:hypothetical protein MNB_SV-4-1223 [hydrothermal vent metagenome]|uniref:Uncharacterized protein n=1 Tax=hydrothermal vent metagenome TaxID=652676 RepID=A0A1W1E857_9ZZZZ